MKRNSVKRGHVKIPGKAKPILKHIHLVFIAILFLAISIVTAIFVQNQSSRTVVKLPAVGIHKAQYPTPKTPQTLAQLLDLPPAEFDGCDIARMNLLCAEGLPGAENLNLNECLATLDQWAQHINIETDRNSHRFRENPAYYLNSEAFYKMLMMSVILYEDYGVRYNPKLITSPDATSGDEHFFANSGDVLIHELLGSKRMGTCSSMPVLYIALGRRLEYPLKLVKAKGHLFMRWDSPTEKFNMDATGKGLDKLDDEYYKQWPFPLSGSDIQAEDYLKSLSGPEELSVFLSIRGECQTVNGLLGDALSSFNIACRYAPNWRGNQMMLTQARARLARPTITSYPQQPINSSIPADPRPVPQ